MRSLPRAAVTLVGLALLLAACAGTSAPAATHAVFGMDFEPFTLPGQSPIGGAIPDDAQLKSLLGVLRGRTAWLKTSGSSAAQERIPCLAHAMGFKVAATAFLNGNADDQAELGRLEANISAGCVELAVVGNEAVWHELLSGTQSATYIKQVRCDTTPPSRPPCSGRPGVMYGAAEPDELYRAGSPGQKYGAADVEAEMAASDIFLTNIPAFNYGDTLAAAAADVPSRYQAISQVATRLTRTHARAWIGESEWPSGCEQFGHADWCKDPRATPTSAAAYFKQFETWAGSAGVHTFYYEAFDNAWAGRFDLGYGNHWGVFDASGKLHQGFEQGFP
jgi:exo-beta-1,3-glucanase (GH17 family)